MSNKTGTAKFYSESAKVQEVHTGYLHKSPAPSAISKHAKSWKHRFFVLFKKTSEDTYHLTYHADNERRDKPLGEIDLSRISLMFIGPETHQMWDWIQKHFKCPPSYVLFLRVEGDTQKHTRDYFLIGENSGDVDGWLNALVRVLKKTPKSEDIEDNRIRSISAPLNCPPPKVEDRHDERWSAPDLMQSSPLDGHYDYPRKLSEPPVPEPATVSVQELKDEIDGDQEESQDNSSEYMDMASVQMALEDDKQETDAASKQSSTSINGHGSFVCNGAVNRDEEDQNKRMQESTGRRYFKETCLFNFSGTSPSNELDKGPLNKNKKNMHVEKEICISQSSLKNSLILTQKEGKPCVSECRQIEDSCLFHKGDQILALNDLLTDTVEELQTYLRRLSKDEVKLTIRRLSGSQPLNTEPCA